MKKDTQIALSLVAVLFTLVTLLTIGYGDFHADSEETYIFQGFFVLFGTSLVGSALYTLMTTLISWRRQFLESQSKQVSRVLKQRLAHADQIRKSFSRVNLSELITPVDSNTELENMKRAPKISVIIVFLFIMIGTLVFPSLEPDTWTSYAKSFYYCCVTISTVGYGDVTPVTDNGKGFLIYFAIFGCSLVAKAASEAIASFTLVETYEQNHKASRELQKLSVESLKVIRDNNIISVITHQEDTNKKSELNKLEFSMLVLSMLGKVSDEDLVKCSLLFEDMDTNHSGALTFEEIDALTAILSQEKEQRLHEERKRHGKLTNKLHDLSIFVYDIIFEMSYCVYCAGKDLTSIPTFISLLLVRTFIDNFGCGIYHWFQPRNDENFDNVPDTSDSQSRL